MRKYNITSIAGVLCLAPRRAGAVHVRENEWPIVAAEDLSAGRYKLVTLAGTFAQAADKARVAGVLKFVATSGQNGSAVYEGATKAFVGGAVSTPGWPLKAANSGWLVACNSGDQANARFVGVGNAATAASGDLAAIWIDAMVPGVWGG